MSIVAWKARIDVRRRWPSLLGLAVLLGLGAGATMTAALGARRASTAYPRLLAWSHTSDFNTGGGDKETFTRQLAQLEALPQVRDAVHIYSAAAVRTSSGRMLFPPALSALVDPSGRAGRTIERGKLLKGRAADPNRPDEAVIGFGTEAKDLTVGSRVVTVIAPDGGEPVEVPVRVVGIGVGPSDIPASGIYTFHSMLLTPAYFRAHRAALEAQDPSSFQGIAVRLKRGEADVAAVRREAARLGITIDIPVLTSERSKAVQRTVRYEVAALWMLSFGLGLATAAVAGQALARHVRLAEADADTLSSVGMTSRERVGASVLRDLVIAVGATAIAVGVTIAASPLTPIGLTRTAEPDPGVRIDGPVLLTGGLATFLGVVLLCVVPAVLANRQRKRAGAHHRVLAAGTGLPAPVAVGTRLALDPGRGSATVPVRSAVLGTTLAVAAIAMAFTFSSSYHHLRDTPRVLGYSWDLLADTEAPGGNAELAARLRRDPDVAGVSLGGAGNANVGGRDLLVYEYEPGSGLDPVVAAGRPPSGRGEIALGATTMHRLGAGIGDDVTVVAGEDARPARLHVVGRIITSAFMFEVHEPGDGAAVSLATARRLDPGMRAGVMVRFKAGRDLTAEAERLGQDYFVTTRQQPAELTALRNVSTIPLTFAALLGLLGVATLVHAVATTVRRRRRDLALLATLGMIRRQLRMTVMTEGVTLAAIALVVGVPVGVAVGRYAWRRFADDLAVLPVARTSGVPLVALIAATFAVAALASLVPARVGARTRPAEVLRSE